MASQLRHTGASGWGFSLLELVVVIAILGIVAMIAVPRLSRGSQGAAETSLEQDLAILRNAIELYRAEHGGAAPAKDDVQIALCGYSNSAGTSFSTTQDTTHILGPYLGPTPPPLPVGSMKGCTAISRSGSGSVGWIYSADDGSIVANCDADEVGASGKPYNQY